VDGGGTASYVYDAEGRRVRKTTGSTSVDYLYDLAGHVISEMSSSGAWNRGEVYAGGQHVATYENGTTYFTHADWLGTERLRTKVDGSPYSTWASYPFGEGSSSPNPSPNHFTGKERDSETNLDYFGARYYGNAIGRFLTPDWAAKATAVPYAEFADPQSLNLYSYVRNNPLSRIDPDGHEVDLAGNNKDKAEEQKRIVANASKKGEAALFKTVTDKNGKTKLVLDKDKAADFKGNHSKGFNMLVQAIDAKPTITVQMIDQDSHILSSDPTTKNITVGLDRNVSGFDKVNPMRDANGKEVPNPFSIIAGHEVLGHARLEVLGDPGWYQDGPGSKTFKIENILRKEQGIPLRPEGEP